MCGLTGILAFNEIGRFNLINLQRSVDDLAHRGPDAQGSYLHDRAGLGHRRLSVIDLSSDANQPMHDPSERYWIVYNGEIYNYKSVREELQQAGMQFRTQSDTEVVLNAFIRYGIKCLDKLNGFFAFAFYDQQQNELYIARDRYGIKPLYYYADEDKLIFASEFRSILNFGIEKELNTEALFLFFQLNYIPAPFSIINGVHKLLPGHYILIANKQVEIKKWYELNSSATEEPVRVDYKRRVRELLEQSVERRLVSDVPVGTFLSGGIDSSIITGLASGFTDKLNTFSIGYRDEPFFDESEYARMVSDHFKTNHTEFSLTNKELFENLYNVLDHFDEPFADSSALPVYILSKETRKHVTVALSGDGADELFAGYNKHAAFLQAFNPGMNEKLVYAFRGLWKILPSSRNNSFSNLIRQLKRFADGYPLPVPEQYWFWCLLNTEDNVRKLLNPDFSSSIDSQKISSARSEWLAGISGTIESVLQTDLQFMLPNDMLYKVDLMSMAHGLEVRVPFLDHELVEYVSTIPADLRITKGRKKALLKDVFADFLPEPVLRRPKKGFEVPLLRWLRKDLGSLIKDELLNEKFISEQGIFNPDEISLYRRKLKSRSPGDVHAHIWALVIFQWWWKKYIA